MPHAPTHGLLAIYPHITTRDRELLQLLDDHQVLTTDQIHRLLFHARRTCQLRLGELRQLGLLERFRFARTGGGSQPWHWTLGHDGERFQAAAHNRTEPTTRSSRQRITRLSANPNLTHLLTANEFFVRLAEHARRHPQARLDRWWSETVATQQFLKVRPDGHGLWSAADTTVGFWLEADTGTEPLGRVTAKLDGYARLAATGGPRYPVLFWVGSQAREEHLHRLLRQADAEVPTATATHDADPAEAVWLPGGGIERVRLQQLPSSHGRANAANPNFDDGELNLNLSVSHFAV
ncbi:MAG TPA: replication-relaxation family protein [Rugosimonospora sp.]|jgi:hypothetical protein